MTIQLNALIEELQTGDPSVTARAVIKAIDLPDKWADVFFPLLRDECRRRDRNHTREIEEFFDEGQLPPTDSAVTRSDFLASHFFAGDERGYVRWDRATIEDHQARIDFLCRQVSGLMSTVKRHQHAIEQIQAAGATCLADLEEVAA